MVLVGKGRGVFDGVKVESRVGVGWGGALVVKTTEGEGVGVWVGEMVAVAVSVIGGGEGERVLVLIAGAGIVGEIVAVGVTFFSNGPRPNPQPAKRIMAKTKSVPTRPIQKVTESRRKDTRNRKNANLIRRLLCVIHSLIE